MPPGLSSMMEKQPQMRLSMQACLKAATSGPSSVHMISGLVSIERPCSAYSGKTTRSIVPRLRRALPTMATIFSRLRRKVGLGDDVRQLQLHQPDDDAVAAFVEAAETVHRKLSYLVIDSSPGAPASERPGEDVAIMMRSVRM